MTKPKRAAVYARISQDRSGAQAGVNRQLEDTRKLAAERGWEVVGEFVDNDVSAKQRRWSTSQGKFVNRTRPGYDALLDAIREGRVDVVLAWHPDRLYRRIRDLEDLVDMLERNDVDVVTVKAARVNLSTAADRLNARLLGSVAMYESEVKSWRVAAAAARRAREGRFSGGMRPYAYEPDGVTIREEEALHLRTAYDGILAGRSLAEVTRRLTAARSTSSTGRPWTTSSLRMGAAVSAVRWPGHPSGGDRGRSGVARCRGPRDVGDGAGGPDRPGPPDHPGQCASPSAHQVKVGQAADSALSPAKTCAASPA